MKYLTITSRNRRRLLGTACAVALVASLAAGPVLPAVAQQSEVNRLNEQIRQAQNRNAAARGSVGTLQAQATNYQEAINRLQQQIDALNGALAASQAEQASLQQKITENQAELDKQKAILADNLKVIYVTGQMSTTEMLASTQDLSTFVDADTYRKAMQQQIQDTVSRIKKLQDELNAQKAKVEQLIAEQKQQQEQLQANQSEMNRLLALNQEQQNAYNAQINATNGQISELRREQAAAISRMFQGSGDSLVAGNDGNDTYPAQWKNLGLDAVIDRWGMYNRECVSYTAWKVHESGRHMPYWGGRGNANQWDDNARRAGIPVDGSPRVGDVAVSNSGTYGHVMYVEAVYGDGSIYISQYNARWDGRYSEGRLSAATIRAKGLVFIHF